MDRVSFFTPITFGDLPTSSKEKALEYVDGYFNLTGHSARVIVKDTLETKKHYDKPNLIISALKVLSYFTLVLPLVVLGLKAALRANISYTYTESPKNTSACSLSKDLFQNERDAISKAIDEGSFNKLQQLFNEMETSDLKDELLETTIERLLPINLDCALKLNEQPYVLESKKLFSQFKIVKALIQEGGNYKEHLEALPISLEKDALLKLAVAKEVDAKNLTVLNYFNGSFKNAKVKNEALGLTFSLLCKSNANLFTKVVMRSAANQDALIVEFMTFICQKKAFDSAEELLNIECSTPYTKMKLFSLASVALIHSDKIDDGVALIKSVFSHLAAREAVIDVINALFAKEAYAKIIDLVADNCSNYTSHFIEALALNFCPGIDIKYSEDYLRDQIAKKLMALELENSAKKIFSTA